MNYVICNTRYLQVIKQYPKYNHILLKVFSMAM